MIRHCVMLQLPERYDRSELTSVMNGLAMVAERLDGCSGFVAGENRDYEDKSPEYPYGFTIDFDNATALSGYAKDPEHRALGQRLVTLCEGAERITVFDIVRRD